MDEPSAPTDPPPGTPTGTPDVRPVDLRDYVDFSQDEARRIRVMATGRLALDLWCVEPQQSTPVIHHEERDVTYTVIGGRSWFVTEAGDIGLDPMGAILVPAGVMHGIDNRGADPLIVVASMSPPDQHAPDDPVVLEMEAVRDDEAGSLGASIRRTVRGLFDL